MKLPSYMDLMSSSTPAREQDGIGFFKGEGSLVRFSEPVRFRALFPPPPTPGVYAILQRDATWQPRPFKPIYFGKAVDLSARVTASHEKYDDWCRVASGANNLYVAFCSMWRSSDSDRSLLETSLIKRYQPECNKTSKAADAFYGALLQTQPTAPVSLSSLLRPPKRFKI